MDRRSKLLAILIIIVTIIFGVLFFTMSYDSDEDLVGEIEDILELGGVL